MSAFLLVLSLLISSCASSNVYQSGNVQYEFLDRPGIVSSSVTALAYCRMADRDEEGNCLPEKLSEPRLVSATGLVPSLFGPMITAAGIAGAGVAIGHGLSHSGATTNLTSGAALSNFSYQGVNIRGHYGPGW